MARGNDDEDKGRKRFRTLLNEIGDRSIKEAILLDDDMRRVYLQLPNIPSTREVLCEVIWKKALEGDRYAIEFIADRTEGKVAQEHQIGNAQNAGPFEIVIST
jgi:hypothetical protein